MMASRWRGWVGGLGLTLGLLSGCSAPGSGGGSTASGGQEIRIAPDGNFAAAIAGLAPGDRLTLAAGSYSNVHLTLKDIHGTADAWITIRGEPGARVQLKGMQKKRIITVDGCSYVRFENLEVGPDGWDAFKFFGHNSDIVVDDCFLHDMGGGGINCSGIESMRRLRVSHCHIMHTGGNGEGMYLGHQDGGGKSVYDSVFEYNLIHDTGGDQGDGIELNEGGLGNIIRYNVVFNTNYPCIFVENRGSGTPNQVIGNVCWTSNNESMQVNGNAQVAHNVVMGGKIAYAFGRSVEQTNNRHYLAGETSPESLMTLGLMRIRLNRANTAAARAEGLEGEGGLEVLKPKPLAEADGGKQAAADLAERIGRVTLFKTEAVAAVRQRAVARVVSLMADKPDNFGQLPVENVLKAVRIIEADANSGLQVVPLNVKLFENQKGYAVAVIGKPLTIPWRRLDANLLGRILTGLGTANGRRLSIEDRVLICECYALGGWSYQLNNHLAAIDQVDHAQLQRFQSAIEAMLDEPLPPSVPRPEKKRGREETPPQDLAPDANSAPVADAFAVN